MYQGNIHILFALHFACKVQAMEYIVYKRFKAKGIEGHFNLPYGAIVYEENGFLFAEDGRRICAVTSENGWEHFRPNTPESAYRLNLLDRLYRYYKNGCHSSDFDPEKWPGAINYYWKNLLRTMPTSKLIEYYRKRLGKPPEMEV